VTITTEDVIKYVNAFTFLSCQAAASQAWYCQEPDGASLIYEADWKNLLGEQSEADYIKALGLIMNE
jgi:hypothetical protein